MDISRSPDDLTARAKIRDAAFELIAEQGVRGAPLRGIARAAGVSPSLVNHHYGSKQGVVDAVAGWVHELLQSVSVADGGSSDPAEANARRSAAFGALLDDVPLLRSYIRRMLLDESPEGLEWFAGIVDRGAADLRRRETIGLARPSDDVTAVAAILDFIALAPVLLPRHLEHALGGGGEATVQRWQAATSELLRSGLYPRTSNPSNT